MYNRLIVDHFSNPRNVGGIEDPDAEIIIGNPVCGDKVVLPEPLGPKKPKMIPVGTCRERPSRALTEPKPPVRFSIRMPVSGMLVLRSSDACRCFTNHQLYRVLCTATARHVRQKAQQPMAHGLGTRVHDAPNE
ncbi:MAG: iron-sulfur cluster assembly scaffold protein [Dehalococcoidia bacterium]|nr:MAG: iron-sulfur cluster assembly scaffold protein [Dehalococcoidia bacterium]